MTPDPHPSGGLHRAVTRAERGPRRCNVVLVLLMVALVVSAVIAQARVARAAGGPPVLGRPRLERRLRRLPPRPPADQRRQPPRRGS
jgi:hypothetical protein